MNEINWRNVAQEYDLSPAEFTEQIYITAVAAASMEMEELNEDSISTIENIYGQDYKLTIEKLKEEE